MLNKIILLSLCFILILSLSAIAETPVEKYAHSKRFISGGSISLINNRFGNSGSIQIVIDTQLGLEYHIYTSGFNGAPCLLNVYKIDSSQVKKWQEVYDGR